ncbi:multicopper oxidase family protein [Actinotalea sp. Marseille-Q4924]|uniref:multicopper oxidase family protein n=1 Tax=Actinotalea sp. Marseille-Q4924 TaxID=2866571 RepID=UPI001CE3FDC3|nr:multicopper oxidase family protein [Actinotalea sp. Marseille-Q4924]
MEPISRRGAIQLGVLGAASVAVGVVGLSRTGVPPDLTPVGRAPTAGSAVDGLAMKEPPTLRSTDGLLRVRLDVAPTEVDVAGTRARMLTYSGHLPGPTWRVRPGARVDVRLHNGLEEPTNLHVHGLHVSPEGNGDNPFVSVLPGESFEHVIHIPEDHPAGTFWYHPHHHGHVADQIFGGLYGAIVVEDDDVPVDRDRVLVISDTSFTTDGAVRSASRSERMAGREGELVLVNGEVRPVLRARPGEVERWRLVNACVSRYLDVALPGQEALVLARDQGRDAPPAPLESVLLAPGNRVELLVTARSGTVELVSRGHDRGAPGMGMMRGRSDLSGPVALATLVVSGEATSGEVSPPGPPARVDLRTAEPARRRDIAFTMGMGMGMGMRGAGMTFGFDGRGFDADRLDQEVSGGTVEEWTIRNRTPMDHPFHLHVWPMQVVDDDGARPDEPRWRDVVNVPARGAVTVRIAFDDVIGRTVYHCHVLDHEDLGMMGAVEARAPGPM